MITPAEPITAVSRVPQFIGHVLLAEDDPAFRDLVGAFLRRRGYRVSSVADAASVLHRLGLRGPPEHRVPIDVLVTDVYMPAGDGYASAYACTGLRVLRSIREAGGRLPVIVVTAFGDEATHAEANRHDVFAVLDKPFELGVLLTAIDQACFGHR